MHVIVIRCNREICVNNQAMKKFYANFFFNIIIAKVQRTHQFMHEVEVKALKMEELLRVSCIRGYHVYKDIASYSAPEHESQLSSF